MIQRLKFRGKVIKPIELGSIFTGGNEVPIGEWIVAPSDGWNLGVFFTYVTLGNIDPSTVGQWTGLKDSKEQEIWEGDIVEHEDTYGDNPPEFSKFEVKFAAGSFYLSYMGDEGDDYNCDILIQPITIIGNIHDAPKSGGKEQA